MTNQISKEDVLQIAKELNFDRRIKLNDAIINLVLERFDDEAEADPTGTWDLIVEQLLYNIQGEIDMVYDHLKKNYVNSEVTSGEFIHSEVIHSMFAEEVAVQGIQKFLDWDESDETFALKKSDGFNKGWTIHY